MQLITKKQILESLAGRYKIQFPKNRQLLDGRWTDDIIQNLQNEDSLTEERAIEILGTKGWTDNTCDECGKDVYAAVQLGEEPDYESATANICFNCLEKALKLKE